ncbi:hypothetical protein ABBQ32_011245 [Trebouxia sp. C0010 RCD-2024]
MPVTGYRPILHFHRQESQRLNRQQKQQQGHSSRSCCCWRCGLTFPGLLELPGNIYDDVSDIYILSGGPRVIPSFKTAALQRNHDPKLIPQIIHQTYKSSKVPNSVRPMMQSWRLANPNWEIRFYDDEACLDFVQHEFPEYLEAYRYMVVLRMGGLYADVDTECRRAMDDIIKPRDTLLVGWENEFATPEIAAHRNYARTRQVLQWVFAAAPGHPALRDICDHIAQNVYTVFSQNTNRDTLERTGPGVFTDYVLKHAAMHPPSKRDDPWTVRLLPKVHFGVHPVGLDGIEPDAPGITVLHHYLGTWKVRGGWSRKRIDLYRLWRKVKSFVDPDSSKPEKTVDKPSWQAPHQTGLFPVSIEWEPPFTMLVDLIGHGDHQAGSDVSASLTAWGSWQPALAPTRGPTVLEALIGSLGGRGSNRVLLDIGAGQGLFSLAAAARGHRAIAFELSPNSLASFEASMAFNGFQDLITLHKVALGQQNESICVERGGPPKPHIFGGTNPASIPIHVRAQVDLARGYSHPQLHNVSAVGSSRASAAAAGHEQWPWVKCTKAAQRCKGALFVANETKIAAVRISANGWDAGILHGLQEVIMSSPPSVILMELAPSQMEAVGLADAATLLQQLYQLGYTEISHSGYVCDERWYNLTRSIRLRGLGFAGQDSLRQPTWCTLPPDKFHALSARTSQQQRPENILLIYKTAPKPQPAVAAPTPAATNISGTGLPVAGVAKPYTSQDLAAQQAFQ